MQQSLRDHDAFLITGGDGGPTSEVGIGAGTVLESTSVRGDTAGRSQRRGGIEDHRHYWLGDSGGNRPRARRPRSPMRLSLAEREEISRAWRQGGRWPRSP